LPVIEVFAQALSTGWASFDFLKALFTFCIFASVDGALRRLEPAAAVAREALLVSGAACAGRAKCDAEEDCCARGTTREFNFAIWGLSMIILIRCVF